MAFGRFVLTSRAACSPRRTRSRGEAGSINRVIEGSTALLERRASRYSRAFTDSLAALLAPSAARAPMRSSRVRSQALMGVHRAMVS